MTSFLASSLALCTVATQEMPACLGLQETVPGVNTATNLLESPWNKELNLEKCLLMLVQVLVLEKPCIQGVTLQRNCIRAMVIIALKLTTSHCVQYHTWSLWDPGQFARTCLIYKTNITCCYLKRIDLEIPPLGIDSWETIIDICKDLATRMFTAIVLINHTSAF